MVSIQNGFKTQKYFSVSIKWLQNAKISKCFKGTLTSFEISSKKHKRIQQRSRSIPPNAIQNKFLAKLPNSNNMAAFWPKLYKMKRGAKREDEGEFYTCSRPPSPL